MHTHALVQCQLIHIHCTSVFSQRSYGIPYSVHAYGDSLSNVVIQRRLQHTARHVVHMR